MQFSFVITIWRWTFEITVDFFDLDPSDRTLGFGIHIGW